MLYPHKIHTAEDVAKFFTFLIKDRELNFHPDTPFADYINYETAKPAFTDAQCRELEERLDQCFWIQGIDVYEIGLCILQPLIEEHAHKNG